MNGRSDRFISLGARLTLALALGLAAPSALADEPVAQPAAAPAATRAEVLFQEGKALLEQGQFSSACEKLAQSDTIDPNISTLGLLAGCHEQQGRSATARREYLETVKRAEAAGDARAAFARERAAALEPKIPKITIRAARPAPSMEVTLGHDRVAPEQLGSEIPVDPGAYELIARAPGMRDLRVTITLKEGASEVVDLPALVPPDGPPYLLGSGAPAAPPPVPSVKPALPPPAQPSTSDLGLSRRQAAAIALGGVTLVGVIEGLLFTFRATTTNAESVTIHETCTTHSECEVGRAYREEAFSSAKIATVSFVVSAVAGAATIVLVAIPSGTAPSADTSASARNVWVAPRIGSTEGGIWFGGRF